MFHFVNIQVEENPLSNPSLTKQQKQRQQQWQQKQQKQ